MSDKTTDYDDFPSEPTNYEKWHKEYRSTPLTIEKIEMLETQLGKLRTYGDLEDWISGLDRELTTIISDMRD